MTRTPEQIIAELTDQLQRAQAHNQRLVEEIERLNDIIDHVLPGRPTEVHHHHYHAGPSPAEQQRSGKTYNEY